MTTRAGYWDCIHCGREHQVLLGDSNNDVSRCPVVGLDQWIHVPTDWIREESKESMNVRTSESWIH